MFSIWKNYNVYIVIFGGSMVNIQVTGPTHSKKGYIMALVAKTLRDAGCEVHLQGEETHLVEKIKTEDEVIKTKLEGQKIVITELQTSM